MRFLITVGTLIFAAAIFLIVVPRWTHPPIPAIQMGPPPTSMIQFGRGQLNEPVSQNLLPVLPPPSAGGPSATAAYHNVKVLTDVSAAEFMRLQEAMTRWVSPRKGCDFCHAGKDYASDAKPEKHVARLMLAMTRHINADWKQHVKEQGVTCYTCHRGKPVPAEVWYPSIPRPKHGIAAKQENWREVADNVKKFFPDDSLDLYLLGEEPIAAQSRTALPSGTVAEQIVVKRIYEMMMEMSEGIGVNCGYCHNSRALMSWYQGTPYRWDGYWGIELTRDLNRNYLLQVPGILPQKRELVHETAWPVLPDRESGPLAGNGLVLCATCHEARPQPLDGASELGAYPGLTGPAPAGGNHS